MPSCQISKNLVKTLSEMKRVTADQECVAADQACVAYTVLGRDYNPTD